MKVENLINQLEPYKGMELVSKLHLEIKEDVLDKRSYKFPHDSFDVAIEIDDVGYSDNVVLLGITPKGE